jgi:hypothetical protein
MHEQDARTECLNCGTPSNVDEVGLCEACQEAEQAELDMLDVIHGFWEA